MELSIQERLKDLRVERGLTLEQLAEQTHLSKSALEMCIRDSLSPEQIRRSRLRQGHQRLGRGPSRPCGPAEGRHGRFGSGR